ncbi:MAG TPA: thiosulfate oxidation carrier protein SoxY [Campylobacterales bacterium]|nr:thiosulfate oxidation carrier protein SoxY [Campylobacterales bacterium]HHS92741.1 thiosulfate oxidation carrier protein SoxY [Campylobacterales bacterium]
MERRNFIKSFMTTSAAVAVAPAMVMAKEEAKKEESKKEAIKGPNDLPYEAALKAIAGDKEVKDSDKIKLTVPEIAENGAVVPVKVEVDSPMEEKNYVKAIHVLNTKNSNARCIDAMLTPANGEAKFASRIKLAESQDVVAVAALSDGTFIKAGKGVKVTIGGCG